MLWEGGRFALSIGSRKGSGCALELGPPLSEYSFYGPGFGGQGGSKILALRIGSHMGSDCTLELGPPLSD